MSVLIEALERILAWLLTNQPSYALALQPGLTYDQIQEKIKGLPFKLPTEVIELYQWRNGTKDSDQHTARFFPGFTFNSLDQALIHYNELIDFSVKSGRILCFDPISKDSWEENIEPSDRYNTIWFPMFACENKDYYLAIGNENQEVSTAILNFSIEDPDTYPKYESLTKMMLTIAECYEENIYHLLEFGIGVNNEEQEESIRLKYNPTLEYLY
jgi:cell wall assembly regulator SMI1